VRKYNGKCTCDKGDESQETRKDTRERRQEYTDNIGVERQHTVREKRRVDKN
jgi:hypothetical protein